jgi:putative glycosyltransferase
MELSIVTTMFCSAPYLKEFYKRVCAEAEKITKDFEMIFVNDGSPDESLKTAVAFHAVDPRVKVIDLSRNFGHYKAIMTGLAHAKGNLVFLIDCDLEERPELLGEFYDVLKNTEADVAYGVQKSRKGRFFERFSGDVFYGLFNLLSNYPIPANALVARLMTKRYVSSLLEYKDQEVFLDGIQVLAGYVQAPVFTDKLHKGETTYNFRRKVSILVNSVTSFSNKPLQLIFFLGFFILSLSTGAALYVLIRKILSSDFTFGWASTIISLWFIGGLIIFCLGIIGIYLSKIFMETKQRPYTVIRKIYGQDDRNDA